MNKKTKKQQQVFVIYKDKTLPNGGRAYYDCEWVQFRTDSINFEPTQHLYLLDSKDGNDVLVKRINLNDISYFDVFEQVSTELYKLKAERINHDFTHICKTREQVTELTQQEAYK